MIAIVDYGVGNLFSVAKAIASLDVETKVTSDAAVLAAADKIVLPGVGAFGDCMKNLTASGLIPTIEESVNAGVPLLGICVGLQILFEGSEETPGVRGLGWLRGTVRRIEAPGLKVPHMGWNSLSMTDDPASRALFAGIGDTPYVYFVHSYAAVPEETGVVLATTDYGSALTAAVAKANILATQFHPEKSGDVGLRILKNFVTGAWGK